MDMNKILVVLIVLLLIGSCKTEQSPQAAIAPTPISNVEDLLSQFEKACQLHDRKSIMQTMDDAYRKEQLDAALNGRTDQFLKEFFCGQAVDRSGFKCFEFEEIKKVSKEYIKQIDEKTHEVFYLIQTEGVIVEKSWIIRKRIDEEGKVHYGFEGAFG